MTNLADIAFGLAAAKERAEVSSEQLKLVVNGPEGIEVDTDTGPVPTVKEFLRQAKQQIDDTILQDVGNLSEAITQVDQARSDTQVFKEQAQDLTTQATEVVQEGFNAFGDATDPDKGAAMVGFDDITAADVMDQARPMQSYTALRNYAGRARGVRITSPAIAGIFQRDDEDDAAQDDGGTVIVDAAGRRWKRVFDTVRAAYFGSPDSESLRRAISCAKRIGARVYLDQVEYAISETVVIDDSAVQLIGSNGPGWNAASDQRCRLTWEGEHGGTVVRVLTPKGALERKRTGQGLTGVTVDGSKSAAVSLEITSTYGGVYRDVTVTGATQRNLFLWGYIVGEIADSPTNQRHLFDRVLIDIGSETEVRNSVGIFLTGASEGDGANVSMCDFTSVMVRKRSGVGLMIHNADNTHWTNLVFHNADPTTPCIEIQGNNDPCGTNFFHGLSAAGAGAIRIKGIESGFPFNPKGNFFILDSGNGTQLPVADPGCTYMAFSSNGVVDVPAMLNVAAGGDLYGTLKARDLAGPNDPVFVYNSTGRSIVLASGPNAEEQWGIDFRGPNPRIRRLSGTATQLEVDMDIKTSGRVDFGDWVGTGAKAGTATLPANPVGFLRIKIAGVEKRVPFYDAL